MDNQFYTYFKSTYSKRIEQWAPCFRYHVVINTKMYLESFQVLKQIYLQHKQYLCWLTCHNSYENSSCQIVFQCLTKLDKGKHTHQVCEINKRHKAAMALLSLKPALKCMDTTNQPIMEDWIAKKWVLCHLAEHAALHASVKVLHNLSCMYPYVHMLMHGHNNAHGSV